MRIVYFLCTLPAICWALCTPGVPGKDAQDFNISVTKNIVTGCTTQTLPGLSPIIICNGTNAAACPPPTITFTGMPAGCAKVSGVGSAAFCNGTAGGTGATGSAGLKGPTGAAGPLPTVTALTPLCQSIVNTLGQSVVICNGTSNTTGATGAQGLQGNQGTNGTNGATGARGLQGFSGILPNYYIFDGFAGWGQAQINTALAAVGTAGGGVLLLAPNPNFGGIYIQILTTDCLAPIVIPSGVILDLGGNTIAMTSGATTACAPMISFGAAAGGGTVIVQNQPLIANATEGTATVTIASTIGTASLASGQVCTLTQGYPQGSVPSLANAVITQTLRIASFVNSTGVVTFRKLLVANFGTNGAFTSKLSCSTLRASGSGLRNGYLSYGGSALNTATGSSLIQILGGTNIVLSELKIIGPTVATTVVPISISGMLDSRIDNVHIESVSTTGSVLQISGSTGVTIRNLKVVSCTAAAALTLTNSFHLALNDLELQQTSAIALDVQSSGFNTVDNLVATGAGTRGIKFESTSYRNMLHGVVISGGAGYGLEFAGSGDYGNQLHGLTLKFNTLGPVLFGAGAVGNYLDGDITGTPVSSVSYDGILGNTVRQVVAPTNGFVAFGVHYNATVTTADFPTTRMLIISTVNDLQLSFAMMGGDSTLRTNTATGLS